MRNYFRWGSPLWLPEGSVQALLALLVVGFYLWKESAMDELRIIVWAVLIFYFGFRLPEKNSSTWKK